MSYFLSWIFFCACFLIGIGGASPVALAQKAASDGGKSSKAEWERVVAAAKKEGKLVIYGQSSVDRENLYKNQFEAAFPGIKVNYISNSGPARIATERRAGRYFPDVFVGALSGGRFVQALRPKGAFQPLRSALILPEVLDMSNWFEKKLWFADKEEKYALMFSLAASTLIAINTDLVNPKEITSYKQLLEPKWRGKMVSNDIRRGGAGGGNVKFLYTHPDLGGSYIRKLFGEMDLTLSRNARQAVDWLARGRYSIYLFPTMSDVDDAREVGLPVDVVSPLQMKEGYSAVSGLTNLVLMNPTPHPNAAKVFVNWLLSRDGQAAFEKTLKYPSLRIDTPTKNILREFVIPKKGGDFMVVSLEKYWHLNPEIRQMLRGLRR